MYGKLREEVKRIAKCKEPQKRKFDLYFFLGDLFYNLVKSDLYFIRYLDLIIENQDKNLIGYQEVRIKFDDMTKKIFDHICNQKPEYKQRLRFII